MTTAIGLHLILTLSLLAAPPPHSDHLRPLILPLSLSSPRKSDVSNTTLRRQLESATPSARMRLYDDLLTNGYYTTRIWIGTPSQEFALIVDTGSTVTYVPCNSCTHCGKHQYRGGNSPYYNIELRELHVAGKKLDISPQVFDGKYGTVLDSGTTYAYLPEMAFVAFKHAIMNELHDLKRIRGPDPNYKDICFSGAGREVSELSKTFPSVDMIFENGQKYSMSPENYLFKHSKIAGAYCLGVFQNGKDPTTLLGGIVVRNTLVTYDREGLKVGFWKTNCSELWERLNISNTSSAPPPSDEGVPTEVSPPASAPTGVTSHVVSGDIQVRYIVVALSLSANYSDLKPRASEFPGFIAKELGFNISQVHLLNATAVGNGSLISCSIYPEGSAEVFSNTSAMRIISRLAEHSLHLPDTVGNYKLVDWKFQPSLERNWWQQHYLVVFLAIILTLILGLSMYAIWFIWRRRQETTIPYKPVGSDSAPVSEQELQPL